MPATIILDAGHGGREPGAVFEGRREADDNLRLALAVGALLEEDGYPVLYTRTQDVYQAPYEKAMIANHSDADVLISFHRNSSPEPEQYRGSQVLVYRNEGLAGELADNIGRELAAAGFADLGIDERPDLVILRRTRMPAVLIETGFINTKEDNQIFDEKFPEIARAIADGIEETLARTKAETEEICYQVQVGAYREKENAERRRQRLAALGYPVSLSEEEGWFRVRVGLFHELDNAVRMEQVLRSRGMDTWIVTVPCRRT